MYTTNMVKSLHKNKNMGGCSPQVKALKRCDKTGGDTPRESRPTPLKGGQEDMDGTRAVTAAQAVKSSKHGGVVHPPTEEEEIFPLGTETTGKYLTEKDAAKYKKCIHGRGCVCSSHCHNSRLDGFARRKRERANKNANASSDTNDSKTTEKKKTRYFKCQLGHEHCQHMDDHGHIGHPRISSSDLALEEIANATSADQAEALEEILQIKEAATLLEAPEVVSLTRTQEPKEINFNDTVPVRTENEHAHVESFDSVIMAKELITTMIGNAVEIDRKSVV